MASSRPRPLDGYTLHLAAGPNIILLTPGANYSFDSSTTISPASWSPTVRWSCRDALVEQPQGIRGRRHSEPGKLVFASPATSWLTFAMQLVTNTNVQ